MSRGERRQHEARVYQRHLRSPVPLLWKGRYAGKTPGKLCSCVMCGNPRRHLGEVTRAELATAAESPRDLHAEHEAARHDCYDDGCHNADGCDCAACMPVYTPPRHEPLRVPLTLRDLPDMDWHLEPDELAF